MGYFCLDMKLASVCFVSHVLPKYYENDYTKINFTGYSVDYRGKS